jgi:hypothetical protein
MHDESFVSLSLSLSVSLSSVSFSSPVINWSHLEKLSHWLLAECRWKRREWDISCKFFFSSPISHNKRWDATNTFLSNHTALFLGVFFLRRIKYLVDI